MWVYGSNSGGCIMDKALKLKAIIERVFEENKDIFDRLSSNYDQNSIAYWEQDGRSKPDAK
jgi:hypothetical protein